MLEFESLFDLSKTKTHWTDDDGMIWLHGQKLCHALGFKNVAQTIGMHVAEGDKQLVDIGAIQDSWFVSEPGVWSLILASKSAKAKEFKDFLIRKALPSIRKNGYYLDPNATREQLGQLQKDILHHTNWTRDEFLIDLSEDQAERRSLHQAPVRHGWEDF